MSFNIETMISGHEADPAAEAEKAAREERRENGIEATVNYIRTDGRHTFAKGVLTTAHSSSSYSLPVFVVESNYRTTDPMVVGENYRPIDIPGKLTCGPDALARPEILSAAKAAGYNIEYAEAADSVG